MIWRALELAKVSTLDMIRVSQKGGTRGKELVLTKTEWVRMMGRLFRLVSRSLWRDEIAPLTEHVFTGVSGKHDNIGGTLSKKVDVRELERWLRASEDDYPRLWQAPPLKRAPSPTTMKRQHILAQREQQLALQREQEARAKAARAKARALEKVQTAIAAAAVRGAEMRAGRPPLSRPTSASPIRVRLPDSLPDSPPAGSLNRRPATAGATSPLRHSSSALPTALSTSAAAGGCCAAEEGAAGMCTASMGMGGFTHVSSFESFLLSGSQKKGKLSRPGTAGAANTAASWRSASASHLAHPPRLTVIRHSASNSLLPNPYSPYPPYSRAASRQPARARSAGPLRVMPPAGLLQEQERRAGAEM